MTATATVVKQPQPKEIEAKERAWVEYAKPINRKQFNPKVFEDCVRKHAHKFKEQFNADDLLEAFDPAFTKLAKNDAFWGRDHRKRELLRTLRNIKVWDETNQRYRPVFITHSYAEELKVEIGKATHGTLTGIASKAFASFEAVPDAPIGSTYLTDRQARTANVQACIESLIDVIELQAKDKRGTKRTYDLACVTVLRKMLKDLKLMREKW